MTKMCHHIMINTHISDKHITGTGKAKGGGGGGGGGGSSVARVIAIDPTDTIAPTGMIVTGMIAAITDMTSSITATGVAGDSVRMGNSTHRSVNIW